MPLAHPMLRSYRTVLSRLAATKDCSRSAIPDLPWPLPRPYRALVDRVGPQEIAGDFIIRHGTSTANNNLRVSYPNLEIGRKWMIFALSGTGDAWALPLNSQHLEVAFVNHDDEDRATATPIGIDLKGWLRLAYLMRETENTEQTTGLNRHLRAELDRLSPGLSEKYPYDLSPGNERSL